MFCKFSKFPWLFVTKIFSRNRHYWNNMHSIDLSPPKEVLGSTTLKRELFKKKIIIPQMEIEEKCLKKVLSLLKKYLLKMEHLKPVVSANLNSNLRTILLHPLAISSWESLPVKELTQENVSEKNFKFGEIELGYENWRADEILRAVLPKDEESLSSYSKIGHILHINLRDHLLPYKELIGQVFRDKIPGCKTVVNKSHIIDNTYRNFALELINGEENYVVETKENGVTFQFDFSKVYWNPRLSTEHLRIVETLKAGDILYDVFAGVGPFSVPTARKKCLVLANDLNPESFKWLNENIKKNKCAQNIKTYNLDGKEFISQIFKTDLINKINELRDIDSRNIIITMNLPALAVEFLSSFQGLFVNEEDLMNKHWNDPLVHVYCFLKGENTKEMVIDYVEENAGFTIQDDLKDVYFVRNVAPQKDMFRVSFYLRRKLLFQLSESTKRESSISESKDHLSNKKICI